MRPRELFQQDSNRTLRRCLRRDFPRRARRCVQIRRGWFCQAAADDRAAVHHSLDRHESGNFEFCAGEDHWSARWSGARRFVVSRSGFYLPDPVRVPGPRDRVIFQLDPDRRAPALQLCRSFIPSNPFHALSNNIVPAVVLFFIVFGVALIGVERKQVALDVFNVAKEALSRATKAVVTLTPYGVFAIAANTAGTLNLDQIARIQVYLITYVIVALLVAIWVLPGLVAALTPFSYREVLGPTRDALITALCGGRFVHRPADPDPGMQGSARASPARRRAGQGRCRK